MSYEDWWEQARKTARELKKMIKENNEKKDKSK